MSSKHPEVENRSSAQPQNSGESPDAQESSEPKVGEPTPDADETWRIRVQSVVPLFQQGDGTAQTSSFLFLTFFTDFGELRAGFMQARYEQYARLNIAVRAAEFLYYVKTGEEVEVKVRPNVTLPQVTDKIWGHPVVMVYVD